MTREEILAHQQRIAAIRATPLGGAFFKFKHACERAWISDTEDSLTDKNKVSTKRYHEELRAREKEFLALLEPLIGATNGPI